MSAAKINDFLKHYSAGMAGQIAQHSTLEGVKGCVITLILPAKHKYLMSDLACDKLHGAMMKHLGQTCRLIVEVRG